jgi:2-iminobutanoate/2-iminopropanoate deaminase
MKQQISSTKGPKALGPYSAGIATEGLVFLSGQLGVNTEGNLVSEDVVEQTRKVFENIVLFTVLSVVLSVGFFDGGFTSPSGFPGFFAVFVKTTVLLDDMKDFAKVNEEYAKYFDGIYPARSCFEVAALPKNAKVEIECIAIKK